MTPEPGTKTLNGAEILEVVTRACPLESYRNTSVLLVIPDNTRTAPVGKVFKALFSWIGRETRSFDILVALGTHPSMSEEAILARLELSPEDRRDTYGKVRFFNHAWDNPDALTQVGVLGREVVSQLTDGLFGIDVPVEINRLLFEYDRVIILGPVFPHEVVGFSGGNKYLFPGVGGAQILNFFHWLGAVITNPRIIGQTMTPVRQVIDQAASLVKVDKLCFCMVVAPGNRLAGLFAGSPEEAWGQAAELSRKLHITYKSKPFHTILSCAPPMYDELWTAGKCMYKLEPVLADGGELTIYAPHLKELSRSHAQHIRRIGYHCRDFFLKQWDRYQHFPWGVLAHSTHVRGGGTFENAIELCRAKVTLATQFPKSLCDEISLGYRDPAQIDPEVYANREDQGVLLVPRAGEMLFRLKE